MQPERPPECISPKYRGSPKLAFTSTLPFQFPFSVEGERGMQKVRDVKIYMDGAGILRRAEIVSEMALSVSVNHGIIVLKTNPTSQCIA